MMSFNTFPSSAFGGYMDYGSLSLDYGAVCMDYGSPTLPLVPSDNISEGTRGYKPE